MRHWVVGSILTGSILTSSVLTGGILTLSGLSSAVRADETETPTAVDVDNPGIEHLDQATDLKLNAESMTDLEKVVTHCEQALAKGLNAENAAFARQLMSATLYEHAARIGEVIFDKNPPDRRWHLLRQFALRDLNKALEISPDSAEVHLLVARLEALPGGDRGKGRASADRAVALLADNKLELSAALVQRGSYQEDAEQRMADYSQAIKLDPNNEDALRARGLLRLEQTDNAGAADDLLHLLEKSDKDVLALQAVAEALANQQKFEDALGFLQKAQDANPTSPVPHLLRARIHLVQKQTDAAKADLDEALKIQPQNEIALMFRARLNLETGKFEDARHDVDQVLELTPGHPQALLLHSVVMSATDQFDLAVRDLQHLLRLDPKNVPLRLQLAAMHSRSKQPKLAIEVLNEVLKEDPQQFDALVGRADANLTMGQHREAIGDYDQALQIKPKDTTVLNNLAWILATSPDDGVRDGKRSIDLGRLACEETKFEKPHILSTYAAGFAEIGDFEAAVKWSTEAVTKGELELAQITDEADKKHLAEQLQQLQNELDSYKQTKPWREALKSEEAADRDATQVDDLEPQSDKEAKPDTDSKEVAPEEDNAT